MATTSFVSSGLEFVPNNYAAPLNTANVPEAFHLVQDFLAQSAIGRALVEPAKLSGSQIKAFWESGMYDNGGETGNPSIIFEYEETEYVITAGTICAAMGFPEYSSYTIGVGDDELIRMMREIGYSGSLNKIGQLKRPFLRKEWSFFFDCITRAFGKKCTNWDAIPTDSLQIGYSLLYDSHFDFARLVLNNLGEKMTENRGVVYFSRFCQILFSYCIEGVEVIEEDISSFKLHKRVFSDLINKDVKKGAVGDLLLPASVQQFLNNQANPILQAPSQPQPIQTELPPSTSDKPVRGGRIKHVGTKPARSARSNTDAGVSRSNEPKGHYKKKRANRSKTVNEDDSDREILHQRKRRLVASYLFDNVDEAVQHETPEVVAEEHAVNADAEDRTVVDAEAPEVFVQEATEDNEVASVPDLANADVDQDDLFADLGIENILEAYPSISVCDTEDVAADQPTQILDESIAEKGEEVDQVLEAAVGRINETMVETTVQTEDIVAEFVPVEAEFPVVNSEIPEAAQTNSDHANSDHAISAQPNSDHVNSDQANSGINAESSDSDESIPFLGDPTTESIKEKQRATEEHFREMHYANWLGEDCIFSSQRAAEFVNKTAKEITNPELLSHFKATIVQVKSLHKRFDETHKVVLGLSNDITLKELASRKDRAQFSSLQKDQEEIKQRLTNVESNQADMSAKLDSIAA